MSEQRSYPRHIKTDAGDIEFRLMSRADEEAVLAFAQKLPTHDLLFLPRNISQPKVLTAWINEIERGAIASLLAIRDGRVVGCGTLVRDPHSWSPHVGELRMVVSTDVRGQPPARAHPSTPPSGSHRHAATRSADRAPGCRSRQPCRP